MTLAQQIVLGAVAAGLLALATFQLGWHCGAREAEHQIGRAWFDAEIASLLDEADDGDGGIRAADEPLHH